MANVTWDSGNKSANCTLSGLTATSSSGAVGVFATSGQASGKFYFEITQGATAFTTDALGLGELTGAVAAGTGAGLASLSFASATSCSVNINNAAVISSATFGAVTTGNGTVICVAIDMDNRAIWFRVGATANWNGSSSANPATNTGGASVASIGGNGLSLVPHAYLAATSHAITANFGDSAFTGTVPTGFTAGFPTGGANNALITQVGSEVWRSAPSDARFTQIGSEVWRSVTAGASLSTSVPGGQITFTGYPPSSVDDSITAVPSGQITFTGYAPSSVSDGVTSVPGGSITFTGYPPTAVGDGVTSVPGGAINFVGYPPVSVDDEVTAVPGGTITFTGAAPTSVVVAPSSAAFAFMM